jgi:hypothetical protein
MENENSKGLIKCKVCGEYNGKIMKKYLDWGNDFFNNSPEEGEKPISVTCLCNGILCPKCKENKIHRPVSNSYIESSNSIVHWPWFTGMTKCDVCRKKM